jgi:hypothetical protein
VKKGRIQALQIGGLKLAEPEVSFSDFQLSGGGGDGLGGNLGSGFLRQFKVIFDLPHGRMVFERP